MELAVLVGESDVSHPTSWPEGTGEGDLNAYVKQDTSM